MVTAHKSYRDATLKITGFNLKEVRDANKEHDEEEEEGDDLEPTSEE